MWSYNHSPVNNDWLAHVGVKGMKWSHMDGKANGGRKAGEDEKKSGTPGSEETSKKEKEKKEESKTPRTLKTESASKKSSDKKSSSSSSSKKSKGEDYVKQSSSSSKKANSTSKKQRTKGEEYVKRVIEMLLEWRNPLVPGLNMLGMLFSIEIRPTPMFQDQCLIIDQIDRD